MAYNVSETELAEVRELARMGLQLATLHTSTPCWHASHSTASHWAYQPVLLLGAWHETGTPALCCHNHRSIESAENCGRKFLKAFDLTENENWRTA